MPLTATATRNSQGGPDAVYEAEGDDGVRRATA